MLYSQVAKTILYPVISILGTREQRRNSNVVTGGFVDDRIVSLSGVKSTHYNYFSVHVHVQFGVNTLRDQDVLYDQADNFIII